MPKKAFARPSRATLEKSQPKGTEKELLVSSRSQPAREKDFVVQGQSKTSGKKASNWINFVRLIAFLAVIGLTLYIYSIREHVQEFEQFGYAGVFFIALMANATVLLPAPGVAIIYAMGAVFNPLWVGIIAGCGGALGELTGYLAGYSGQAVIERSDIYDRFQPWITKYGGWAILVLSAIPNPFFDVAGIAAGISKMPMPKFLAFTWVGQIIKMTSFAFAGYYSLEWLRNFY